MDVSPCATMTCRCMWLPYQRLRMRLGCCPPCCADLVGPPLPAQRPRHDKDLVGPPLPAQQPGHDKEDTVAHLTAGDRCTSCRDIGQGMAILTHRFQFVACKRAVRCADAGTCACAGTQSLPQIFHNGDHLELIAPISTLSSQSLPNTQGHVTCITGPA